MWAKLERFQFDNEDAVFDFSTRLGRENGWSRAYTARVIQEYKRFLLLAMHAGHPVTPSDEVDQVWHLHLVYTRSYWQDLCAQVLGRPLHHEPTKGGIDEGSKFRLQYERTLDSYRRIFGEEPPADIWPGVEECFKPKLHRRVDVLRHWTLPRPTWLKWLRPRFIIPAGAAVIIAVMVAGCSEVSVFDWRGPDFLIFYAIGFGVAFLASLVFVSLARRKTQRGTTRETPTDPYEVAFLGGGGRRMVDAALAALFTRKLVTLETPKNGRASVGAAEGGDDQNLHPVEQRVWQALPLNRRAEVRSVREALQPVVEGMQQHLAGRGLVLSPEELTNLRWLASLPMLVMMTVGVIKFFVGLGRDKPVIILFFCLFASVFVIALRMALLRKRTDAGEALWWNIKSSGHKSPMTRCDAGTGFDPTLAALMVALGGTEALATPMYQPLHDAIHRQGANSSSGCGSGGCGGGGCGGGGCGGGGCGGCGGGD